MKKLYDKFLRISEDEKITEQKFIAKMATSVFTIFLSVVMLCGTTFAFFTNTVTTGVGTISSATYNVELIKPNTVTLVDGIYTAGVAENNIHTFYLQATGTASNGYCLVTLKTLNDTQQWKTSHISKDEHIEIQITATEGTTFALSVASSWCPVDCAANHGESTVAITLSLPAETFEIPSGLIQGETISITSMPDMAVFNAQTAESIPENCELYGWIVESDMHKEIVLSADLETVLKSVYDIEPEWTIQLIPLYKQLPQTETEQPQTDIYIAVEGDTLESVAALYGITVEELYALNNFTAETIITAGMEIIVPVLEETQQPPQTEIYIAVEGDTLESVAALYGITVEELYALNNFAAETIITAGMEITVPVLEETNVPQPTPTVEPSPSIEPTPTPTAESSTTVEPTEEPVEEPTEEPTEERIEESAEESSPTVEPSPSAEVSPSVESTPTLDPDAISEISDEIKTEKISEIVSAESTPSPSASVNIPSGNADEADI